ncbi:MAG TPA: glycoside hydrolase family 6 protein [Anaeromyxobacter sp.]|nr:glycoside hydrolase family 6 protein [Anaeromyxobacter sp.]
MTSQPKNARRWTARAALAAGLLVALAAPARAQTHLDNPFAGARMYVDPAFTANADATAAATADPALAAEMRRVGRQPRAIWIERITAVPTMATHLDRAAAAGDDLVLFVLRNLPGRDCTALYYDGELPVDGGLARYKAEFIDPIAAIARDPRYAGIRIVFVVEPDSLVHLVTGLNDPECAQIHSSGTYVSGIQYAVNALHAIPNVYLYLDLAYSGWLGWTSNAGPMVSLLNSVSSGFAAGKDALDGFATNTAQYVPLKEPWLSAHQVVAGREVWTAKFYEYNPDIDEAGYAADMWGRLTAAGWPGSIGMIVDTSRNGWGGSQRPRAPSTQVFDFERFVNESRVDRRAHRGLWCNVAGAGIGELPGAVPPSFAATYLDAFVWVKTPGESDGASSPAPEGPPFDRWCDPAYVIPYGFPTGALPDAPARGRWFPAQFAELVKNMWPAATAPVFSLTVTSNPLGLFASTPAGIDCGAVCAASFPAGTEVTLTAMAATSAWPFQGWTGACAGITTPTCVVSMTEARTVGASFGEVSLTVERAGAGAGTVTSSPGGIDCGASCTAIYSPSTLVTLTAKAASGSGFVAWGGACASAGARPTCVVAMGSSSRQVSATFQPGTWHPLDVTLDQSGICNPPPGCVPGQMCAAVCYGGSAVTSSPAGISCGASGGPCTGAFASGTSVVLTATPNPNTLNRFAGWVGACSGTAPTCVVPMTQAQSVTARFVANVHYTLSVARAGTGAGTVTGAGGALDCGATCSALFSSGVTVTLTATAATGSTFRGWSGACAGTALTCTVRMDQAQAVTATFDASSTTPCANPITFSWNTGNFNTTGAACYRTSQRVNGWGCSNFAGRTVRLNASTTTTACGAGPFPLAKHADGFTYFTVSAGQYPWASMYVW